MIAALLLALAVQAEPEAEGRKVLVERFERIGRSAPQEDGALTRAARRLATRALELNARDAAGLVPLTAALSTEGGWDPQPTAVVIKADVADLLANLTKRTDLATEPVSHYGLGIASKANQGALVLLLARRRAELRPTARSFKEPPRSQRLCAALVPPLESAELYLTRPDGSVDRQDLKKVGGEWCAMIEFPRVGRHTVEVLARGPRGPEVAAMYFVNVGHTTQDAQERAEAEPTTLEEARAQILARTNALRSSSGLTAVVRDHALEVIAQRYAQRMAEERFFAHVAPDGQDLKARLVSAGYPYQGAGENLGLAAGPLEAHFGIEHSPGHRRNLLDPSHRRMGVGVAPGDDQQTVVVEVLTSPAEDAGVDPLTAAYAAIDHARKERKLPTLAHDAVLEAIAQEHVQKALKRDLAKVELPGVRPVHERVFDVLEEAGTVTVDFFVASSPALVTDSKNLIEKRNTRVGVGLIKGDSAQYGKDRFWVMVVYVSSRGTQ